MPVATRAPASGAPPTVSVVLATHNGARFLGAQLASLARQTHPPCEIIASDDCSTDATGELLAAFARDVAIPVRLRRNDPALGFGENFLRASLDATGELIAFCDQDDIWHAEKLARCARAFDDPEAVLVAHTARLIDAAGVPLGPWPQGIALDRALGPLSYDPWAVFAGFTMVFRADLLRVLPKDARGIDYITGRVPLAHDRWVMFLAGMLGRVHEIGAELVDYRQHGGNLFGAGPRVAPARGVERVRADAARYLAAAMANRALIDRIDATVAERFPLFDHGAVAAYWDRAIAQQRARCAVYDARSLPSACSRIVTNVARGTYRNVHDARFRFRSLGRDIATTLRATGLRAGSSGAGISSATGADRR